MAEASAARFWLTAAAGLAVTAAAAYLSLTSGALDISVADVVKTLLRIHPNANHDLVVFQFRLPRIVLSALVGFALGVAGTVIQGITRNALADPGILGINAGAGLAAVLFMLLYQGSAHLTGRLGIMVMPLFSLAGGLAACALIFAVARQKGALNPQRLLLAGIAAASGFGAATLYVSLKMNPSDYEMAAVWLAGSIYNATWDFALAMLPWLAVLAPLLWYRAPMLDLFQLGEASMLGLGARVEREKNALLLCSVGLVSACVAVSGSIGFVGLIAPHMAKRLVGLRHRRVIPISGIAGAALVVTADFIGKTVFAPAELAAGIVLSLIGVPYFVLLLLKRRRL